MLSTWLIMLAVSGPEARAQGIPCRYELAATIAAPPGPINSSPTIALAISPNGRYVVGYFNFDAVGAARAFAYDMQTSIFHALPLINGTFTSTATDVNDAGQIAGHIGGVAGDFAFVYDVSAGTYALLPPLHPDGQCWATGVTAQGMVCGYRGILGPPNYETSAFIWSPGGGTVTDLGLINGRSTRASDLNDGGVTCGTMFVDNVEIGFLWDGQTLTPLPTLAGMQTVTFAINASNHVVGWSKVPTETWPFFTAHATRWDKDGITDLGGLPGYNSSTAERLNDAGIILGVSFPLRGFIWQDGLMRDLDRLVDPHPDIAQIIAGGGITPDATLCATAYHTSGPLVSVVLRPVITVGDVVPDCRVNIDDVLAIITWWESSNSLVDINNDGIVNVLDLLIVIENWTV